MDLPPNARPAHWWRAVIDLHHAGVVAVLLMAVGHLILLRGVSLGLIIMFVIPPLAAVGVAARRGIRTSFRLLAIAFLFFLATGILIADHPNVLPGMDGWNGRLPLIQSRILTWYSGIYLFYLIVILPPFILGICLRHHQRGEPSPLSPATCWLGLFTWIVVLFSLVGNLPALFRWLMR